MEAEEKHHFLKEWRQSMQMTQSAFAQYVGMSTSNYNYLEAGRIGYTQDSLEKIAKKLEIRPADILSVNPLQPEPSHPYEETLEWRLNRIFEELSASDQLLAIDLVSALSTHRLKQFMQRARSSRGKDNQEPDN
jgi:transcriptional regulator with XRE-family HTH domain